MGIEPRVLSTSTLGEASKSRDAWPSRRAAMLANLFVRVGRGSRRLETLLGAAIACLLVLTQVGFAGAQTSFGKMRAEPRSALVIGNGGYEVGPLANTVNDARLMAQTLRSVGFDVTLVTNVDRDGMHEAIFEFRDRLKQQRGGVALFYFAGHGVQVNGQNYLIPTDAVMEQPRDVKTRAVSLDEVLAAVEIARARVNLVILDACRNNPFPVADRSMRRGLALVDAPEGTLIAYATGPGNVAADGVGGNSPYTAALAKHIKDGTRADDVFMAVRRDVLSSSSGAQTPWEENSLTQPFYFNVPKPCAEGESWDGSRCIKAAVCPPGAQQLEDGSCVHEAKCPEGTKEVGGECLMEATCPRGSGFEDGRCVFQTDSTCPSGFREVAGTCVAAATCPDGFELVDRGCTPKCADHLEWNGSACVGPGSGSPRSTPARDSGESNSLRKTLFWGGLATLAVGTGAFLYASNKADFQDECVEGSDGPVCPESAVGDYNAGKDAAHLATGAFIVGGLATSVGIMMWTREPSKRASLRNGSGVAFQLGVGPTSAAIKGRF